MKKLFLILTKWEWLPEKDKDHYRAEYKEGVKIDVVKVSF